VPANLGPANLLLGPANLLQRRRRVGRNGQGDVDDVLLVQYFLSLIGKNPAPGSQLTELASIPVTGR